MNIKYFWIIAFISTISYPSFSQYTIINNQDATIYTPIQIRHLNERTCQLLSKSGSKLITDSIYVYNVYYFQTFRSLTKDDFLDELFFKKLNLQPLYEKDKNGNSFPSSLSIIINKQNEFVGMSWIFYFTEADKCAPSFVSWYLPVIREKEKRNIMCYFDLFGVGYHGNILFGRTYKNEIIVFHSQKLDTVKVTPIKEFVDKYWSEYFD